MNRDLLIQIGEALYGANWKADIAQDLNVSNRTLRGWIKTGSIPEGVQSDLVVLCQNARTQLDDILSELLSELITDNEESFRMRYTDENMQEILNLHKMWLNNEAGGRKAVLIGADLRNVNCLQETSLAKADMRNAQCQGTNLIMLNLSGADLRGADLRRTTLIDADLSDADCRDSDFSGSDLSDSDLSGADFRKADLSETCLFSAKLGGANFSYTNLSGVHGYIQLGTTSDGTEYGLCYHPSDSDGESEVYIKAGKRWHTMWYVGGMQHWPEDGYETSTTIQKERAALLEYAIERIRFAGWKMALGID